MNNIMLSVLQPSIPCCLGRLLAWQTYPYLGFCVAQHDSRSAQTALTVFGLKLLVADYCGVWHRRYYDIPSMRCGSVSPNLGNTRPQNPEAVNPQISIIEGHPTSPPQRLPSTIH